MKKLLPILLILGLLFSLAACTPKNPDPNESAGTESADDELTCKVIDRVKLTGQANDIGYDYAFPMVVFPGGDVEAINETLNKEIFDGLYVAMCKDNIEAGDYPAYDSISYEYGVYKNHLSIAVYSHMSGTSYQEIRVYNINLETCDFCSDEEIITLCGVSKEDWNANKTKRIAFEDYVYNKVCFEAGKGSDEYFYGEQAMAATLDAKALAEARPLVKNDGLYICAKLGQVAGPLYRYMIFPYDADYTEDFEKFFAEFDPNNIVEPEPLRIEAVTAYTLQLDSSIYSIPKIECNKTDMSAINQKIYNDLIGILNSAQSYYNQNPDEQLPVSFLGYVSGRHERFFSILIHYDQSYSGLDIYKVYTVDINNGQEATKEELIQSFGLKMDEYNVQVKGLLGSYAIGDNVNLFYSEIGEELWNALNKTISEQNVQAAVPYINQKGDLSFVGDIYMVAGPEKMAETFNYNAKISDSYYQLLAKG